MLVSRPPLMADTLKVANVSVDGWGTWPFLR